MGPVPSSRLPTSISPPAAPNEGIRKLFNAVPPRSNPPVVASVPRKKSRRVISIDSPPLVSPISLPPWQSGPRSSVIGSQLLEQVVDKGHRDPHLLRVAPGLRPLVHRGEWTPNHGQRRDTFVSVDCTVNPRTRIASAGRGVPADLVPLVRLE